MAGAKGLGIEVSDDQVELIDRLLSQLQEYSQHTNLVAKAQPEIVVRDHIIDSLTLVPIIKARAQGGQRLIDIGSGAGFPGLLLAIMLPQVQIHLLDSTAKKTKFLSQAAAALAVSDRVQVHTARAEELSHDGKFRAQFDFSTARAVGKLDLVAELCLPFLKVGGCLLAQKSREQAGLEQPQAQDALSVLGGRIAAVEAPNMEATQRDVVIVIVEKTAATPSQYPRAGGALKKPIAARAH